MAYRFFLETKPTNDQITLTGDQAHHAANVMRYQVGDEVVLFDGSGMQYRAAIEEIAKKSLLLKIVETSSESRELDCKISIAVALPKGDRQKFLIEKLVELGVHRCIPLKTTRSVAVANPKVIQRLEKQIIEACKQCGRNQLMSLDSQSTVIQLTEISKDIPHRFVAHPYDSEPLSSAQSLAAQSKSALFAIGPEGGFDELEMDQLKNAGFKSISLGATILRTETAALAIAATLGLGNQSND
jgi:16S rRNA (uracil1498-N3)-methyltransferase